MFPQGWVTPAIHDGNGAGTALALPMYMNCWLKSLAVFCGLLLAGVSAATNIPGGGTNGPNVTLTDGGSSVTLANGIMSIVISKSQAQIGTINYTFNNTGSPQTLNLVSGNPNGGKFYWENNVVNSPSFGTYNVVVDPASNGGNYAEVSMFSTAVTGDTMEVHFSMLRGNSGFYATALFGHRSTDPTFSLGECRDNIYAGSIFNWMSVDATRNRLMSVSPSAVDIPVFNAPVEVSLWTNGIYAGQYEDKYKYSADLGVQRVWGWSSVGNGGKNVGLWNISASAEYYNGGPMKRELMCHIGTTILNMLNGTHYGGGTDASWNTNEVWTKVYGPYLIYCNNITNAITDTNTAAQNLYADAIAQSAAELPAWPYSWFTNANFAPASGRGMVTGKIAIADAYNPNASPSNLWVGLVQQPITSATAANGGYDFQKWMKPYQFWVRADAGGNFILSNVIAGVNYTLYAFGPGAAGTFQSQAQSGGSAQTTLDIPASQFSVTVTAGATNNLGTVTWTPTRVGPTVFEIGFPDRTATKYRHGDDWWVGDIGPSPTNPSPIWSKFLEYPFDFPSGPNYIVGQSRWSTDWNFIQPSVPNSSGSYIGTTSTITFSLANAPSGTASFYLALASSLTGRLRIQVNGNDITGSNGYDPAYDGSSVGSNAQVREGVHGVFSDMRTNFPSSYLHAGQNTITINMNNGGSQSHSMYDYVRLEVPNYVPVQPSNTVAYAGNNCSLVCWRPVPGAMSYNLLRSTTSGSNYVSLATGITGPVSGSGWNNATFLDTNTVNGTAYYYVVRSVNPAGTSTNSNEATATPSGSVSTSAPAAPTGLSIGSAVHQSVTLNWSTSAGANFYTVYRSTLINNGGGASNTLSTIVLANNVTSTTYTDTTPTDGSIYSYAVAANSAGGTSSYSVPAAAVPLPTPPASAPSSLTGHFSTTNIVLNWSGVSGAVGYIISRATSVGGPYTFLMSVTELNYTDKGINTNTTYFYQVVAMNAAGVSSPASVTVFAVPPPPLGLSAVAGDSQIVLSWTSVGNASGYFLKRGTSSGNETTVVVGNYTGTSYTNTGLANGTTYYYVVAATNSAGLGANSPEASATPSSVVVAGGRNLVWKGDGSANIWDANGTANWLSNTTATVFVNGDNVTFSDVGSNNVPVTLNGTLQPSLLTFNASKNYTFAGGGFLLGSNALVKLGTGMLTLTGTNYYSGGTLLSNGVIAVFGPTSAVATANNYVFGSGPVDFEGGTLQLYGYNLTDVKVGGNNLGYGTFSNDIVVYGGQTGTILGGPRYFFASKVTGGGVLTLGVNYVRDDVTADWSGFTGSLLVQYIPGATSSTVTNDFRVANSAGLATVHLAIGTNILMYSRATAGAVIPIGEFVANTNVSVAAGGGTSAGTQNAVTWRVGGLNTDCTNAAAFIGTTALIKEGAGAWTLTGLSTHTGATTVNNGTLVVNGSINGSPMTVNGGKLSGTGSISGAAVAVNSAGAFAPGDPASGIGMLTISNNLTLAGGSTTFVQVQHSPLANSAARITGTFTANGTLNVTDLGSGTLASGDSFQLFSSGTYAGAFTNLFLPDLAENLYWNTNALTASGVISVATLTPPTIATFTISNGNLSVSGSGAVGNRSFIVLASTDLTLSSDQWTPIATNQFDAFGNFSLTVTNAVDPSQPQTFYKLQLQ
jgi:autotransporter-associated beta strand protein